MNDFYVYLHIRKDNNKTFYVGKGRKGRANDKRNRNQHWHNIVNKCGYSVEIIFDNLSNEESAQLEINAIAELRYFGYELCNYTNGGEGKLGYKASDETRKKISESQKGKKLSKDHKEKLSKALKGRFVSESTRKKQSINNAFRREHVKAKIALANKKPIIASNGMKFASATDANIWLRENQLSIAKDGSSVTACCTGRQKTAYGMTWKYDTKS